MAASDSSYRNVVPRLRAADPFGAVLKRRRETLSFEITGALESTGTGGGAGSSKGPLES